MPEWLELGSTNVNNIISFFTTILIQTDFKVSCLVPKLQQCKVEVAKDTILNMLEFALGGSS